MVPDVRWGAWPRWSLKRPQSGPVSPETKESGIQREGLAPSSAYLYRVGGRVSRSLCLSSTSEGKERLRDVSVYAGSFQTSIYKVDLWDSFYLRREWRHFRSVFLRSALSFDFTYRLMFLLEGFL